MTRLGSLSALFACLGSAAAQAQTTCGATGSFQHVTRHDGTRTVRTAPGALLFPATLAVNTDGAPNSYHPDDPMGRTRALNTICNAGYAFVGRRLDYRHCRALVAAFNQSRASNWSRPRMQFYAIATRNGRPCVIRGGEYAGYFVSTTSLTADPSKDVCDPARWLDSNRVPFAIYPGHRNFTARGVDTGDIVVIRNRANGRISYGLIGDRGPAWGLGEVSLAFASDLRGGAPLPKTRRETYAFGVPQSQVLILSNAKVQRPFTVERIRAAGERAFADWGGQARLQRCFAG
jgi:hypothetical protein